MSERYVPPAGKAAPVRPRIRWYAVALVVAHLAQLALGAGGLWHLAGGAGLGAVAASVFGIAYLMGWLFLVAPGSPRRLGYRGRLIATLAVGAVVVLLAGQMAAWVPAMVALSVAVMGDALGERPPDRLELPVGSA